MSLFDFLFNASPVIKPNSVDWKFLEKILSIGSMTYANKMVYDGVPIEWTDKPEDNAKYCFSFITGNAIKCLVNKNISNQYLFASALEHEGVHHDQKRVNLGAAGTLYTKPRDSLKRVRITEMEAHGRQCYKLLDDFANDNVSESNARVMIENLPVFLPVFLEAQGFPLSDDKEKTFSQMCEIKKADNLRVEQGILPDFYYNLSHYRMMDFFSNTELDNINKAITLVEEIGVTQLYSVNAKSIFTQEFDILHADQLLNRSGHQYLERLGEKKRTVFWNNVSDIDPNQYAQLEIYERKVQSIKSRRL